VDFILDIPSMNSNCDRTKAINISSKVLEVELSVPDFLHKLECFKESLSFSGSHFGFEEAARIGVDETTAAFIVHLLIFWILFFNKVVQKRCNEMDAELKMGGSVTTKNLMRNRSFRGQSLSTTPNGHFEI
jgi:hypothetical protein